MELADAGPSPRERSKLDKRRRISTAARAVFTEFGYDGASMREIAKRAGVATGTLFLYAPDKRNLLLWVINDDLEEITERTFATIDADHAHEGLLDQLMHAFEARYRYWGADPNLSLHALQELILARDVQPTATSHISHYQQRRIVLQEDVTLLVRAQQRLGRLRADEDAEMIARMVLSVYNAAIRSWLRQETVEVEQGLGELRALLRLALDGCVVASGRGAGGTSG